MKIESKTLTADLALRTQRMIDEVNRVYVPLPEERLNRKPGPEAWSVLECLEHLNLYGDFYLPEIEKALRGAEGKPDPVFRSGWLGNYFARSMQPKNGKINKMKTFADKNPAGSRLTKEVLARFIDRQQQMLILLRQAGTADLTRIKTAVSISKWIRLRLGDTLRFTVYHNERHLAQAQRALKATIADPAPAAGPVSLTVK